MSAGVANLEVTRGDSLAYTFTFQNEDESPVNFTGCTARMQVREAPDFPILQEYSTANGKLSFGSDPEDGVLTLSDTPANTANYTWGVGQYDLEITYANGSVRTELKGYIKLIEDITKNA